MQIGSFEDKNSKNEVFFEHCHKRLALGRPCRCETFLDEQKQFRAVEFISRAAELNFSVFFCFLFF